MCRDSAANAQQSPASEDTGNKRTAKVSQTERVENRYNKMGMDTYHNAMKRKVYEQNEDDDPMELCNCNLYYKLELI